MDFQWYIEGCQSQPGPAENETGFHDVNRFITLLPHPKRNYQSIPDFVENGPIDGNLSPFQVADALANCAKEALNELERVTSENGLELARTQTDTSAADGWALARAHVPRLINVLLIDSRLGRVP